MVKRLGVGGALGNDAKKTKGMIQQGNETGGLGELVFPELTQIILDPDNARNYDAQLTIDDVEYLKKHPSKINDRLNNDEAKIKRYKHVLDLVKSIDKEGLLDPPAVYEKDGMYHLTGGENRYFAHILLGKKIFPCMNKPQPDNELGHLSRGLVHNTIRSNLTTAQKLPQIQKIVDLYEKENKKDITARSLHEVIHESEDMCKLYLRYLRAGEHILQALKEGVISTHREIQSVLDAGNKEAQLAYLDEVRKGEKSVPAKEEEKPAKVKTPVRKKGRKATKVNLGAVEKDDTEVLETIIKKVVGAGRFKSEFADVDWSDVASTQEAWKAFMASMKGSKQ